ncbi:ATP-binding protein [Nonomuraea sp. NPDC049269]|uniref:ATP-binding protein n=1 Tax=Nonomuraea sp. NPDC049269 TaxID=3364349 RepID=UPI00371C6947
MEVVDEMDAHCSARGEVVRPVHPDLDRQEKGGAGHEREMLPTPTQAGVDPHDRLRERDMDGAAKEMANRHNCIELPAFPVSVSIARRHVVRVLKGWGREELVDDAQLIISELVTNGIKAVEPSEHSHGEEIGMFAWCDRHVWIGLHRTVHDVVIEVWDPSRKPPKISHPNASEEGGRGLQVVDKTAACWGYRWPSTGGRIVWAALKTNQGSGALDEPR